MFKWEMIALILVLILSWVTGVGISYAQTLVPDTYTTSDFFASQHDMPVSFTQDRLGNFSGLTATGKSFQQTIIINSMSVRLQRFSIDEVFFYVSDRGIILASGDIEALSIYLLRTV